MKVLQYAFAILPAIALVFAEASGASSPNSALAALIPGDSPVDTCQSPAPDTDLIVIKNLEISPNPPERGQNLTIIASGTVKEDIEDGARVRVIVKYGVIKLLQQDLDLCEQTTKVDLSCPIKAGELSLEREVELPDLIPPGRYSVQADVFTNDERPITCLIAKVVFH